MWSVSLSGDRSLIGTDESDENSDDMGAAYIFCMVNRVWKEESNIFPDDGSIGDWFGNDVDLSLDTAIIESPLL